MQHTFARDLRKTAPRKLVSEKNDEKCDERKNNSSLQRLLLLVHGNSSKTRSRHNRAPCLCDGTRNEEETMKRIAWAPLMVFSLSACEEPVAAYEPAFPPQRWVCGIEYVNFAWGYQRKGAVLDSEGHLWRYDFKGSPASLPNPWQPKDLTALTEEELSVRYNGAVDTGKRVDRADIAHRLPAIVHASKARPTEPRQAGADMGSHTVYCLARNELAGTYRQVLIDQKGDFESTNPSPAAKELAGWLAGVLR
jgi:hypothetical protein